ncbi:MAG: hypothetical protein PVH62_03990 [Anaerolineae bacterium]|jgi:hypothetical protein
MSRRQWLIIAALGVADLVVLLVLGYVVVSSTQALRSAALATPSPAETPRGVLPPTWTPHPTPTPSVRILPTSTPRPPTAEEAAALDRTEEEVAALRGLEPLSPIPRWILTETQLRRRLADDYQGEEWREASRSLAVTLAALDLLDPGSDLSRLWRSIYEEQVVGFYLPPDGEIYLVSNTTVLGALERLVFVHEFAHALQDQHYGLEGLGLQATDQYTHYADRNQAIRALVEGDAALIQERYVERYFSPGDVLAFRQAAARASHVTLDSAPRVVREVLQFPYTYGRDFVAALYERGGWRAVDGAYADPPVSSEQILHPQRYLSGDPPLSVSLSPLTATLDSDWRLVYDAPVGEFLLLLHLEGCLDGPEAAAAAEGWGGDRCLVYQSDTTRETVALLGVVWDTAGEAEEFVESYLGCAEARFGHPADISSDGLACWQGGDALCLAWEGDHARIALGAEQALLEEVLSAVPSPQ